MSRRPATAGRRRARGLLPLAVALSASFAAVAADPLQEEPILGAASAIEPDAGRPETVAVAEGTRLHAEPSAGSPALTIIDIDVELEVLERRGPWSRVRWGDRIGWLSAEGAGRSAPPPAPKGNPASAPTAPSPLGRPADPERVERARGLLGERRPAAQLGPFDLWTDVDDARLLRHLTGAVSDLPGAYRRRFGLEPRLGRQAILLFAREDGYRAYEAAEGEIAGLRAMAHAGNGIAALFVGRRTPDKVRRLLIHELTHLLNRGVFPNPPPAWLEEAMANDLAFNRVDRRGRMQLGTLGGDRTLRETRDWRTRSAATLYLEGPIASLKLLVDRTRARRTLPLPVLVDLAWSEFVAPEGRELRYVQSTFLLRYLLDGDPRLAPGVLAYLAELAAGERGDAESLRRRLGVAWERLERDLAAWIRGPGPER